MKNFLPNPANSKGFTLIELLVAISFVTILGTVGIIGFSNYNQVQQVTQTASNIELMINQARSNAQSVVKEVFDESGNLWSCKSDQLNPSDQLVSYFIAIDSSANEFTLWMNCNPSTKSIDFKKIVLPSDYTLSSTCSSIEFDSLDAKTSFGPPSSSCDITITRNSFSKVIKVDNNGNVDVN